MKGVTVETVRKLAAIKIKLEKACTVDPTFKGGNLGKDLAWLTEKLRKAILKIEGNTEVGDL